MATALRKQDKKLEGVESTIPQPKVVDPNVPKIVIPSNIDGRFFPSVFRSSTPVPAEDKTPAGIARENVDNVLAEMFEKRRQNLEKQRTDDVRLAKYNALGNALTTLVQPLGWAIGGKGTGVTGGVQPYDNRQYLEAFNRAVKASDDIRNLGLMEDEYKLKRAEQDYQTALALENEERTTRRNLEEYQAKADIDLNKESKLVMAKHEARMKEIDQRYGWQKNIAEIRNQYRITKDGKDVDASILADAEKKFNTAWSQYMKRISDLYLAGQAPQGEIYTKDQYYKIFMGEQGFKLGSKSDGSIGSRSGSGKKEDFVK